MMEVKRMVQKGKRTHSSVLNIQKDKLMKTKILLLLTWIFSLTSGYGQSSWCLTHTPVSGLPDTVKTCSGTSTNLTATAGYAQYEWNTGSSSFAILAEFSGVYWVEITDDSSCVAHDTVVVSMINAALSFEDTTLCSPGNLQIGLSAVSGTNSGSLSFNGAGASAWFDASGLPTGNSDRTIECWIKHSGHSLPATIFSYGQVTAGAGFELYLTTSDSLKLVANGITYTAPSVLSTQQWHHLSVAIDHTGKYSFEIDFQQLNLDILNAGFGTNLADTAWIGRSQSGGTAYLNAVVDEFKVWSSLLSPTEMYYWSYLHANEIGAPSLAVYFDFNAPGSQADYDFKHREIGFAMAGASQLVPFASYSYSAYWQNQWISNQAALLYWAAGSTAVQVPVSDGIETCLLTLAVEVPEALNLDPEYAVCNSSSFSLEVPGVYESYSWSNGSTTAVVNLNLSGNYAVSVQTGSCQYSDSFVLDLMQMAILQQDTAICAGSSLQLNAQSSNNLFYWSTDEVSSSIVVTPSESTYFICQNVSPYQTCKDTIQLTVLPLPEIILPDTVKLCNQASYTLFASSNQNYSYSWSTAATTSGISLNTSGLYSVTVHHPNGCSISDQSLMEFHSVWIPQSQYVSCDNQPVTLDCQTLEPIHWSNGSTSTQIIVAPAVSTQYTVYTTQFPACQVSALVEVGGNISSGLPDTLANCNGISITLTANPAYPNYAWSTGSGVNSTTVNQSGNYSVTITDDVGCQAVDAVAVSIIQASVVSNEDTVCEGEMVMITVNSGNYDFLWSTGDTDPVIFENPMVPTEYSVLIDDGISTCYFSTLVEVNVVGTPPIQGEASVIAGDSVYLYTVDGMEASSFDWMVSGGLVDSILGDSIWVIWINPGEGYLQLSEHAISGCDGIPVTLTISVLSDENLENSIIRIYPNPVQSQLHIDGAEPASQISVFTIDGRLVYKQLAGYSTNLDFTALSPGAYFIRVSHKGLSSVYTVIH